MEKFRVISEVFCTHPCHRPTFLPLSSSSSSFTIPLAQHFTSLKFVALFMEFPFVMFTSADNNICFHCRAHHHQHHHQHHDHYHRHCYLGFISYISCLLLEPSAGKMSRKILLNLNKLCCKCTTPHYILSHPFEKDAQPPTLCAMVAAAALWLLELNPASHPGRQKIL